MLQMRAADGCVMINSKTILEKIKQRINQIHWGYFILAMLLSVIWSVSAHVEDLRDFRNIMLFRGQYPERKLAGCSGAGVLVI